MDVEDASTSRRNHVGQVELDWSVEITGDLIEVKAKFLRPFSVVRSRRGDCKGFTHASRIRMLKMVSKVDWSHITSGLFVTLTYPDAVDSSVHLERNKHRYVFLRSLERHVGRQCGALWRIEWVARKSGVNKGKFLPHFHLIIPGICFVPHQKIRQWWKQAIGATGHVATDVKRLSSKRHHAVYIAKYAAKPADPSSLDSVTYLNITGRHWGVHRPRCIPRHKTVVYDGLTEAHVARLKDIARERFTWYGEYAELGYSMFGSLGARMVSAIREIVLDVGDAAE